MEGKKRWGILRMPLDAWLLGDRVVEDKLEYKKGGLCWSGGQCRL
jgi:hypothetical protein